jgi:(p)ppGpp synthase/HD superfamily hydrolase
VTDLEGLVDRARRFAVKAHGTQMYGDKPYVAHIDHVVRVLVSFGYSGDHILAAGYLHDVLEDTHVTCEDLAREFPASAVKLVFAVTDEPGRNRKERKAKTYPKIVAAGDAAVAIKLADRIANVQAAIKAGSRHVEMYRNEHSAFRAALRRDWELNSMWAYLDGMIGWSDWNGGE